MAHLNIDYLDYLVIAADTADNSFTVGIGHSLEFEKTYTIEVTVGSLQFCVGQVVGAQSPIHTVGDKIIITSIKNTPIFYKAVGSSDAFIVGF